VSTSSPNLAKSAAKIDGAIKLACSHLNPETFIFYIEKLKALNAKDKAEYHDFALKCLKGYIENNPLYYLHISSTIRWYNDYPSKSKKSL
jgi:hypothetical protein